MITHYLHPADEPLSLPALATVLDGARLQALRSWHPDRYDIYRCAHSAWRAQAIPVPYAAIIYQIRRLVEHGNLLAFNDGPGRTRAQIAALYEQARDNVRRQHQQQLSNRPRPAAAQVPAELAATA